MQNMNLEQVLGLCNKFNDMALAVLQPTPAETAQAASMMPGMDEIDVAQAVAFNACLGILSFGAVQYISTLRSGDLSKALQHEEFRANQVLVAARSISGVGTVISCLPNELKGSSEAADLLRSNNAPSLAEICELQPAP